jgi:hypothetical protein
MLVGAGVGVVGEAGAGAGLAAALPAAGAGVAGFFGIVRLCLGASGSTSGPFWPQPSSIPARQTTTQAPQVRVGDFIFKVYRAPGSPH